MVGPGTDRVGSEEARHRAVLPVVAPRETVGEAIPATVKTATDIAEGFNQGA